MMRSVKCITKNIIRQRNESSIIPIIWCKQVKQESECFIYAQFAWPLNVQELNFQYNQNLCVLLQRILKSNRKTTINNNSTNGTNMANASTQAAVTETPVDNKETVTFVDTVTLETVQKPGNANVPSLSSSAIVNDVSLGASLERRVKAATITWTPGYVGQTIDPFALFLNDPYVKSKLDYYRFLKGKLHVEFTLNGTPFHYGRMACSYMPSVTGVPSTVYTDIRRNSQCPHVLLDPSTSGKKELICPLVIPWEWLELTSVFGVEVGVIHIYPLNTLQQSNVVTPENITITVFISMTEVELAVPTNQVAATYTAQSAMTTNDEYAKVDGPVSTIATGVASAARMLKNVPIIGSFARATEMAATTIGGMASIFGYSKPNQIEPASYMKRVTVSSMAPAIGKDTSFKLTYDPKQEVTIDPRTVGLDGVDELSFDYLVSIPSYVLQKTWNTTDANGTVIATIPVTPGWYNSTSVTGGVKYEPTAVGWVSNLFNNWTGDMCYCIQVVASQYHRGRLRFTYVPDTATFTEDSYNQFYSQIVDITDAKEFNIAVGWASMYPWKRVEQVDMTDVGTSTSNNGTLVISVVNELTAPLNTQDAKINIWVKGGPNFRVANPGKLDEDDTTNFSYFASQANVDAQCDTYNLALVPTSERDGINAVTFGEEVVSFRTLIKRFGPYKRYNVPCTAIDASEFSILNYFIPHFPAIQGWNPDGWDKTSIAADYDYVQNCALSYLRPAFLGWRGSTRWKCLFNKNINSRFEGRVAVHRYTKSDAIQVVNFEYKQTTDSGWSFAARDFMQNFSDSFNGSQVYYNWNGSGIEIESPNYNALNFSIGDKGAELIGEQMDMLHVQWYMGGGDSGTTKNMSTMDTYVAAGEDMNFFFFTGAPTYWIYTSIPSASSTA